ncbi:hypothetical protein [Streptomyces sp. NPDC093097]|uniref:hypothetical protein n=1 Tax=Streptomyces sp. NPDC093097 TaxID=3366027 RepID=UPI00380314ED
MITIKEADPAEGAAADQRRSPGERSGRRPKTGRGSGRTGGYRSTCLLLHQQLPADAMVAIEARKAMETREAEDVGNAADADGRVRRAGSRGHLCR